MGILALIAEFENDIRRERQMDGIAKAKERGVKFGRKLQLVPDKVEQIIELRRAGKTVPIIMEETGLSKAPQTRCEGLWGPRGARARSEKGPPFAFNQVQIMPLKPKGSVQTMDCHYRSAQAL